MDVCPWTTPHIQNYNKNKEFRYSQFVVQSKTPNLIKKSICNYPYISKKKSIYRYEGPLTDEAVFSKALDGGPKSLEFTKLIHILAEEIKSLCNLEETVNMMNDADESSAFLLELSSFLKELKCPYKKLVTGMELTFLKEF